MKFVIESSSNVLKLIEIFKLIKSLGSYCSLFCKDEYVYIQCMDGSHICLFDVKIMSGWFDEYTAEDETIGFTSSSIVKILSLYVPKTKVIIETDPNGEYMSIEMIFSDGIEKYFKIPLIEIDVDLLEPGENDYSMEFSIKTKTMDKYMSELMIFGEVLSIKSKNDKLILKSGGSEGSSSINVPHDNLEEFVVEEGLKLNVNVDIKYLSMISKFYCVFKTMHVKVDSQFPVCVSFDDSNKHAADNDEEDEPNESLLSIIYYVAPKTTDDDVDDDDSLGSNEIIED